MPDITIGEVLSRARRDAGLTTDQVAASTRIRRSLVEAIERDDFSMCGGDVYARGHIATLARTAGLDPAPLLAEFAATRPAEPTAPLVSLDRDVSSHAERRRPRWGMVTAAAAAVVVGIVGYQAVSGGSGPAGDAVPAPTASAEESAPGATPAPTPTPEPSPTDAIASAPQPEGVTVVLTVAEGTSWVSALEGADQAYAGLLKAGAQQTFADPTRVKLTIGNAGAVRLVVNGVDLGAPGGSGEVARLVFGPGDPTGAAG